MMLAAQVREGRLVALRSMTGDLFTIAAPSRLESWLEQLETAVDNLADTLNALGETLAWRSTSATREVLGSVEATRTLTGCCANTFPRVPTSADTLSATSMPLLSRSTAGLAKPSFGRRQPRRSMNYYPWHNKPVLRRLLEPKQYMDVFFVE
jgi:hypothetical protein